MNIEELKAKASPKYELLAREASSQNAKLDICIKLLARLCELKEAQQDGENLRHEAWLSAKIRDTRVSLWVLSCASLAVYLDVIKIDSNGNFLLEWLMRVIS